jgi:hypothetical protein
MKRPCSKSGLILATPYVIFTVYEVISALTCAARFCGMTFMNAAIPWAYFWLPLIGWSESTQTPLVWFLQVVSYVLNISLLYLIGKRIERALTYKALP